MRFFENIWNPQQLKNIFAFKRITARILAAWALYTFVHTVGNGNDFLQLSFLQATTTLTMHIRVMA